MALDIGRYFVAAVFDGPVAAFGKEHFIEDYPISNELLDLLEEEAKKKFSSLYALHQFEAEWDLDRMFITVGGSIANYATDSEDFVSLNFHVNDKGYLSNITMDR